MKKIFNSTTLLIMGVILFLLGGYQNISYENAIANGCEIKARIVEVIEKTENDSDGYTSTSYTVYADYTYQGKEYKHIKVAKVYDTPRYIGEEIDIVINPENPQKKMIEGGLFLMVGIFLIVSTIIYSIKKVKEQEEKI